MIVSMLTSDKKNPVFWLTVYKLATRQLFTARKIIVSDSTESVARQQSLCFVLRLAGESTADAEQMSPVEFFLPILALIAVNLLVIVGNVMVIAAVFTHSKLRSTTTNKFVVSLAVADLMVGLIVLPFSSVNQVIIPAPINHQYYSKHCDYHRHQIYS